MDPMLEAVEMLRQAREAEPSDMGAWQPREGYQEIDIGCGGLAVRPINHAQASPKYNFLGIDHLLEETVSEGNLDLVKARAHEVLPMLAPGSVKDAVASYFFSEVPEDYAAEVLDMLRPVLGDGFFHVYCRHMEWQRIHLMLERAGYTVVGPDDTDELDIRLSPSARQDLDTMGELRKIAKGEIARLPVEITRTGRLCEFMQEPALIDGYKPTYLMARCR